MSSDCPQCGAKLPAGAPEGLCPACLLKRGLATEPGATGQQDAFVPPQAAQLAATFPQLEIIELIGRGGMGAVYKARQPALDRFVALKILPPRIADSPGFAERFIREARALARLTHPNIVAVHDFGKAGPFHYLIMEFVDGLNLREVERAGRLAPEQALAIVPQICEALQFAHNEGIVHRDIKPENILVDKKGRVKITDFGIAKILGQPSGEAALTGVKDMVGTPHYMAPEQIESPTLVDHRADIFSLGVVFYEMLTGELPLGRFAPPSQKVQMDVRLDEVVLRTLEKEPARRYQQAGEVKTRIETIAATAAVGAAPPSMGFQAAAGIAPPIPPSQQGSDKIILPAFLLAFFLGVFGAHRFYVGKTGTAVLQLLTLGGLGIWATIDWILIVCGAFTDGQGRRITRWVHTDATTPGVKPPNPPPAGGNILTAPSTGIITAPAVALMVAGGWKLLSGTVALTVVSFGGTWLEHFFPRGIGLLYGGISSAAILSILFFKIVPALLILYGGFQMLQRRSYAWAMAAAIISIVACSLIGFPIGIWALVVLSRADVRGAFPCSPAAATPPQTGLFWRNFAIVTACVVAVAIIAALASLIMLALSYSPKSANRVNTGVVKKANGEFRRELDRTFPLDENGNFALDDFNGRVEIHGWTSNAVAVHAVIHGRSAKSVEDADINIDASPHDVRVHTEKISPEDDFPWNWLLNHGNSATVDYTVEVPRGARLKDVSGVNGHIAIEGVCGGITASTVNGEMRIKDAADDLKLNTVNGQIIADMSTLGGGQSVSLDAVNGGMELIVPTNADASFTVTTLNGRITSEFPALEPVKEFPIGHNLKGQLGSGSATVKVNGVNGSFKLRKSGGKTP